MSLNMKPPYTPPPPQVYGGYCHFREHPQADMHGVVRFCIKASSPSDVIWQLGRYGVVIGHTTLNKLWGISLSAVEQELCEKYHACVFFCSPALAYLYPDKYFLNPELMTSARKRQDKQAHEEGARVKASGRPSPRRKVELP